jgi:hypothetical protein
MKFYGKGARKRRSLGDKMLEGAKRRRGAVRPKGRVWLGKVLVMAAAGAAVGEVIGTFAGNAAGSAEIGMSVGCGLGALAGAALLGEANAVESLLAAIFGSAFAFADYYLLQWGGIPFYDVARMSILGPAGVLIGVIIGRSLTREQMGKPLSEDKGK